MSDKLQSLLIDFQSSGHHAEYAKRLRDELSSYNVEATMLAPEPGVRYNQFFDEDRIAYLFNEGYEFKSERQRTPTKARQRALKRVKDYVNSTYDVIHFLHADDLVEACYRELKGWQSPPVVATLNGAFFRGRFFKDAPFTLLSDRIFHPLIVDYLPVRSNKSTLHRCLRDGVFNHVLVPTEGGKQELKRYIPDQNTNVMTTIPDPVEDWFNTLPDKSEARQLIGTEEAEITLLFFGQMRTEKGIDLLLDSLERYRGPAITMVIAGSPKDIKNNSLAGISNPLVDLHVRLEFVPEDEMKAYFAAADGVVFPYRRSFGTNRPSGVFQKACASRLPVIGPDFGFMRDRICQFELGMTFKPEQAASLTETLEEFVKRGLQNVDSSGFKEYVSTQTFHKLAEETATIYRALDE